MGKLILQREAEKQFRKLPTVAQKKITKKLREIAEEPLSGKQLNGEYDGVYSYRAWPYRILYRLRNGEVEVCSIAHRQGVYK
jgi:mRNA-degrading endonuclease RelE of RelBE toxin-antitoxin system